MAPRTCLLLGLLLGAATASQAIDCRRASTPTERRICSSAPLRALDAQLTERYAQARKQSDATLLGISQRAWLREQRDACGDDERCLRQRHAERIERLQRWQELIPLPAQPEGYYQVRRDIPVYDPSSGQWVSAEAEDCLSIGPARDGKHEVALQSFQTNGHSCSLIAQAEREAQGMLIDNEEKDEFEHCRLRLRFTAETIRIELDGSMCRAQCGARAGLGGLEYLRAARVAQPLRACSLDPATRR